MNSYLHGIDVVTRATLTGKRASVIGTKLLPPGAQPAVAPSLPTTEPADGVGTLAGAAAGGILWGDHRVLGIILGASLGRNAPATLRGETRRSALCNLAQTTGGVATSLLVGGGDALRAAAFLVGWVGAGAALFYGGLRKTEEP